MAGGYWLIKTIYQWNRFRRSIYIEIYSSYFEYAFRRKNLIRLSESFYLNNEFGKHKIFYQIAQGKNDKTPQAYILILIPSGIYVLNVKNQSGKVVLKKHGDYKQYYTEKGKNRRLVEGTNSSIRMSISGSFCSIRLWKISRFDSPGMLNSSG